ncbi:MAG: ABC transporter substrate-binding protein [Leptospira sp.]|nr:ABC transporter substrate-binding protein [Leptospira sp.]
MKTLSLFLILLSFLFCRENQEIPESMSEEKLEIAFPTDPVTLDPIFATDLTTEKLIRFLHSPLFRLDAMGNPKPLLVDSYDWDKKSGILRLRIFKNIDVAKIQFSLNRLFTTPGPKKESYRAFKSIESNAKNNSIQLKINKEFQEYSVEYFLTLLALPAASILGETGAYKLMDWKKGNFILLKKSNSDNFKPLFIGQILPEWINIRIIPQSTSGIFLFSKSQLDAMKLSDFLLTHPIAKENSIIQKKGRSVQYVAINNLNPCFDKFFREALNLAIDRPKIIEKILEDQAELTYASIPLSRLPAWNSENKKEYLPKYNLDLAKEKLSKSKCYPKILEQDLDFRMRGDDENQSKGRAVAEYLKSLGLKIKIRGMEKAPLYKENGMGLGDLTFLTWYADYESPIAFLDPLFHSTKIGNGGNRSFYKNPILDKTIQQKNIDEAVNILIEDKPWIFLWSIRENYLISDRVKKYPTIQEYL